MRAATTLSAPTYNTPWQASRTSLIELEAMGRREEPPRPVVFLRLKDVLLGEAETSRIGGSTVLNANRELHSIFQSTSIEEEIQSLLRFLKPYVHFQHLSQIREYLSQYPDLLDIVSPVVITARRHFPRAQLAMDVYQDPEIDDQYLVLYVRLHQYDGSILERLEKAEAEFLDQLVHKEGWIQLTTDFRPPEEEDVF